MAGLLICIPSLHIICVLHLSRAHCQHWAGPVMTPPFLTVCVRAVLALTCIVIICGTSDDDEEDAMLWSHFGDSDWDWNGIGLDMFCKFLLYICNQ
jgi:hypothetical protein